MQSVFTYTGMFGNRNLSGGCSECYMMNVHLNVVLTIFVLETSCGKLMFNNQITGILNSDINSSRDMLKK